MFNGCLLDLLELGNGLHLATSQDSIFMFLTTCVIAGWKVGNRFIYFWYLPSLLDQCIRIVGFCYYWSLGDSLQ